MANVVEFIIKLKDLNSNSIFNRLAQTGDSTFSRLGGRVSSFRNQFGRLGSSIDEIERKLNDLTRTRNMSIDGRQVRQINREMAELETRRNRLTGGSNNSGGGLGRLAGIVGLGSILALGGTMVKSGMDRQLAGASFGVMAGKQQGAALHKDLIKYATDSIYGSEVFGEAKTMLGYGMKANKIMPNLKMIGDVSMGDKNEMQSLALALAQSSGAGKLRGNEMVQYTNTKFNPLMEISKMTGKGLPELNKEMAEGKISFQEIIKALEHATGPMGLFHDGMKKIGETPTGKWIAFTGAIETFGGTLGMKVLPVLGGVATLLNGFLSNQTLFYTVASGIGAMTVAWALYTAWTKKAAIWQGILAVKAWWPLGVIGIIISLITFLALKFDGWGKSALAVWEITKAFFSDLKIGIVDFAQTIAYAFEFAYYKIKGFFEQISHSWQKIKKGDFTDSPFTTEASKKLLVLTQQHAVDVLTNKKGLIANSSAMKNQFGNIGLKWHTDTGDKETSSGKSPLDIVTGKGGTGSSMPSSMASTNSGISGGGVRNLTINVGNLGTGKIDIHAATVTEGAAEIRRIFEEMFLQVVNSGNAAVA